MFSRVEAVSRWSLLSVLVLCSCGTDAPATLVAQGKSKQALTTDSSKFNFEAGLQGWVADTGGCANCVAEWVGSGAGQSEVGPTFLGTGAMKFHIDAANGGSYFVTNTNIAGTDIAADTVISSAIWLPAGASAIVAIQPFDKDSGYNFRGPYINSAVVPSDRWAQVYHKVPADATTPMYALGVQVKLNAAFTGDIYIDSIDWQ